MADDQPKKEAPDQKGDVLVNMHKRLAMGEKLSGESGVGESRGPGRPATPPKW
jgi:hypothetical protein